MTCPQSIIVVCAANLSGSSQCPSDCRKCVYGGEIAVQWNYLGQGYVQYYPNREAIETDLKELRSSGTFPNYSPYVLAQMAVLRAWLYKNPEKVPQKMKAIGSILRGDSFGWYKEKPKPTDIHCNFCGGELGDVEKQEHDNPNFAEYRTCLKCGYQWAKEYWAWLAKVQGVEP